MGREIGAKKPSRLRRETSSRQQVHSLTGLRAATLSRQSLVITMGTRLLFGLVGQAADYILGKLTFTPLRAARLPTTPH